MPRRPSWQPRAPAGAESRTHHRERFVGVEAADARLADHTLDGCDVAAVLLRGFDARRLVVAETRLRDVACLAGRVADLHAQGVRAERLAVRFTSLHSARFVDCSLVGADFTGTTFDHVTFLRCDLSGARFDAAKVVALRAADVDFAGVSGAARLAGATITAGDLLGLAPSLARDMGIELWDGE